MAPAAGSHTPAQQFFAGDSGQTDITVFLDGNTASPLYASASTSISPSYNATLSLNAGDVLSFLVGPSSDGFGYDTTPVAVSLVTATSSDNVASEFTRGGPTVYTEHFGYNASHGMTSLTDKNGKVRTFGYSSDVVTILSKDKTKPWDDFYSGPAALCCSGSFWYSDKQVA